MRRESNPPSEPTPSELTLRAIVLGAMLTAVFTAANVYIGLKIGITFATSIPAAVISMAALRGFRGVSIQENNIVQTIASAAGTLSSVVFVLPGLVMIGWWHGFPYFATVGIIATGGVLGVLFSVPLRRALVTGSDLPYPEGVAAAEVLRVGSAERGGEDNARGLAAIMVGGLVAAGYQLLDKLQLVADELDRNVRLGGSASGAGFSFSLALIGIGHLVGVAVGGAILAGVVIAWGVLVPIYAAPGLAHGAALADAVDMAFHHKVRFVGAGVIAVAAVWALVTVIGPVVRGIIAAMAAARRRGRGEALPLAERDLPIGLVGLAALAMLGPIALLLGPFAGAEPLARHFWLTLGAAVGFVAIAGVIIAAVCGYMAGLIGASNSPVSGTGMLTVAAMALVLVAIFGRSGAGLGSAVTPMTAFALLVTAIIFSISTIANDNLQDLKTGALVGATPWRQQVALVIGVVFGALVIPPVLDLLNATFGFQGAPGAGPHALPAPQAALITAIAQGVLGGSLDWGLIGLGVAIGAGCIAIDLGLRRKRWGGLPPLGVGLGIYLPMAIMIPIPIGAGIGWLYNRWAARQRDPALAERLGVLAATGLIAGESLFGVAFAGMAAATGKAAPLAILPDGWGPAALLGVIAFAGGAALTYRAAMRGGR